MINFSGAGARRVNDREYLDLVLACIEGARRRICVCVFLIDISPERDLRGQVMGLALSLAQRRSLGVDVRVLMTGQVETPQLGVANVATGIFLASYGVPNRRLFEVDAQRIGCHAKFALFDDLAIIGSQNWTDDAFHDNTEDAVLLRGPVTDHLEAEFSRLWRLGKGLPRNEPA